MSRKIEIICDLCGLASEYRYVYVDDNSDVPVTRKVDVQIMHEVEISTGISGTDPLTINDVCYRCREKISKAVIKAIDEILDTHPRNKEKEVTT